MIVKTVRHFKKNELGRSVFQAFVACAVLLLSIADSPVSLATESAEPDAVQEELDPAVAQTLEQKKAREEELRKLSDDIGVSADRQKEIQREIASIDRDRESLNNKILRTADTIKKLETALTDTERRLVRLGENEDEVRRSLNSRRDILAEVLAALQKIGRRPPPALAVKPDDALAAVRSAILLNSVMPEIRLETEALAADLKELGRLKAVIAAERKGLTADALQLAEEKSRLELLLTAKRDERKKTEGLLAQEQKRAEELAQQAGTLKDLITDLESEIKTARQAAEESRKAAAEARKGKKTGDPFSDSGRLAPAMAFADTKGHLPLPVSGDMILDFGQADEFGNMTEGQSISTRAGSRVTSPSDGWVVYSGPFRSLGQLLILNTGGGYHVLLAGMDRIDVELGQFVLAGEPVGVMGKTRWASASTIGLGSSRPILYVEFRKDGSAIDPTPWWERASNEKVRG